MTTSEVGTLPFELDDLKIYLQVSINDGDPAPFVFRSGAPQTYIDPEYVEKLGLKTVRKNGMDVVIDSSLRIGDITLDDIDLIVVPVNETVAHTYGKRIAGLLGYDLLSRYVVTLDYEKQHLQLDDPVEYQTRSHGTTLALNIDTGVPVITAEIAASGHLPARGSFLLATAGRAAIGIMPPFAAKHRLIESLPKRMEAVVNSTAGRPDIIGRVDLHLGTQAIKEIVAAFAQGTGGIWADTTYAGIIGAEIFMKFTTIFDYTHRRLIFEENQWYNDDHRFDASGLFLHWVDEQIVVHHVILGSPAGEAGIKPGDVIVNVNGEPTSSIPLGELRERFKAIGDEVTLDMRRDELKYPTSFILRRIV